ncbi:glycosyltransferase family 9 protein [Marinoscillum sp.]|uniref:glycosyltransferase family 9 protein n=1 Tax=Marinoscillum sp. TaxID=2024838 RepID=UPI003BAC9BC1
MQILIIQTAFIGDVILATPVAESLHASFPTAQIDLVVRKGHESLFDQHPFIHRVMTLDKRKKYVSLWALLKEIRSIRYDLVVNLHRYLSSGLLTVCSGADQTIGFTTNPLSLFFSDRKPHIMDGRHEVERNLSLVQDIVKTSLTTPQLYIEHIDLPKLSLPYITIAPGSVWQTKKVPLSKWVGLISRQPPELSVYIMGGKLDVDDGEWIRDQCDHDVKILAGSLSLLESAAVMKYALMNYTNDSAPLHLASAVNAPVTAVYCSTVPRFGFGPLSDQSVVIETLEQMSCRPCGVHGRHRCPKGHFLCATSINL